MNDQEQEHTEDPWHSRMRMLVPIKELAPSHIEQLIAQTEILEIRKRKFVFKQGDQDNYSFYLLEGKLQLFANEQLIKTILGGDGASYQPLAQLQPRQMSAQAKTPVTVARIDRQLLDKLMSVNGSQAGADFASEAIEVTELDEGTGDWLTILLSSELFTRIPPSNIQMLFETMGSVEMKAGETIIEQGDAGEFYYVVQHGICEVIRKNTKTGKEIVLAELRAGHTFGEEALVADTKRNATVRMKTDGELARLTRDDFIKLIKSPVLHSVSRADASTRVQAGAQLIDVRFPEEYQNSEVPGSINIPLHLLRTQIDKLDPSRPCIICCDSGGRSSAGAFLLTAKGLDAVFVTGGWTATGIETVDTIPTAPPSKPRTSAPIAPPAAPPDSPEPAITASDSDDDVVDPTEADVRASALTAELAKADLQLQEAQHLKQEAEATKQAAEQLVEDKLRSERAAINEEHNKAIATLEEAKRLQAHIKKAKRAAEEEAQRRHHNQASQIERFKRETIDKLRAKEAKISDIYRKNADDMEAMERDRREAAAALKTEKEKLLAHAAASKERMAEAEALKAKLKLQAEKHQAEQEQRAEQQRSQMQATLDAERKKLEAEFACGTAEIEAAQRAKLEAERAKHGAEAEAQRIIEEYKASHEAKRAAELEKLEAERTQLREESERLKQLLADSENTKAEAAQAKKAAEEEALKLRETQQQTPETSGQEIISDEIKEKEEEAAAANRRLKAATFAAQGAKAKQRETEARIGMTYEEENKMTVLLQGELNSWIEEQERLQNSTAERELLETQRLQMDRIKRNADAAKKTKKERNQSFLDEIAEQLGDSGE